MRRRTRPSSRPPHAVTALALLLAAVLGGAGLVALVETREWTRNGALGAAPRRGMSVRDVGVVTAARAERTAPTGARDADVVITAAFTIHRADDGVRAYQRFLLTLRQHFAGPVVIFVEREPGPEGAPLPDTISELCSRLGVELEFVDFDGTGWRQVVWDPEAERWRLWGNEWGLREMLRERFRWYADACARMTDTGRCLATDFRDVYFQADPFARAPAGADLVLAQEPAAYGVGLTIREDVDFDAKWLRDCYGDAALELIGDEAIVCAGTLIGTPSALRVYHDELFVDDAARECNDQAILNFRLYTGDLERAFARHGLRVEVERFGAGTVATVGTLNAKCVDVVAGETVVASVDSCRSDRAIDRERGLFLNDDGSVPAVVHQYDRVPALVDILEEITRELRRLDEEEVVRSSIADAMTMPRA